MWFGKEINFKKIIAKILKTPLCRNESDLNDGKIIYYINLIKHLLLPKLYREHL